MLPWDVEMSCFDMPFLPYKKIGEKKTLQASEDSTAN